MWMRVLGCVVVVLAGVSLYLTLTKRCSTAPVVPIEPAPAVATQSPAPPVSLVLTRVVDVTDIDPLLDPPTGSSPEQRTSTGPVLTAVGYEEPTQKPVPPAHDVKPIPPAAAN